MDGVEIEYSGKVFETYDARDELNNRAPASRVRARISGEILTIV